MVSIHPTAVVSGKAELAEGVSVGAFCVIGERVTIGPHTRLGPHMQIAGPTVIGSGNRFYGQASIGTDPQDLKYRGEESFLFIGDNNLIREFVTINRGTEGGGGKTVIGSDNLLMTGVHVAHDCLVGSHAILANSATLAGHVRIDDFATVGAFSGVHQFCRVGVHAFIGGYSVVTRDALPFVKTVGVRGEGSIFGINTVGLQRRGFSQERIEVLKQAYRILFQKGLKIQDAVKQLWKSQSLTEDVRHLLRFIESSERGFVR